MRVALIQMQVTDNIIDNEKKAISFVKKAAQSQADIVCLPEMFRYKGDNPESSVITNVDKFQALAKTHGINLILGSVKLKKGSKGTNTCFAIDRNGQIVCKYDKNHMYIVNKKDNVYDETKSIIPGNKLGICQLDGIKIGIGICFDLRFPEYFRKLVEQGAEIVFLPSNFMKNTGSIAWSVLSRARAIENQLYFCACNRIGGDACGDTQIIDYSGDVIASLEDGEGVVLADIDLDKQREFRHQFPILKQIKDY